MHLNQKLFIWLANKVPNYYSLRIIKAALVRIAGVELASDSFYFISPFSVDVPENLKIGEGVFFNRNVYVEGVGPVKIGRHCQFGPNVVISTTNHDIFNNMNEVTGSVIINDNVWVGANVVLLQNISLGPNLIVGAGSVVTKSFDNCIIAGNPAKPIKYLK